MSSIKSIEIEYILNVEFCDGESMTIQFDQFALWIPCVISYSVIFLSFK